MARPLPFFVLVAAAVAVLRPAFVAPPPATHRGALTLRNAEPVSAASVAATATAATQAARAAGSVVIRVEELGFPWQTEDPFLFAVYHDDLYPAGDEKMGPEGGTAGHSLGADFGHRSGWNMYHGEIVPGFPRHPHRGFETVTLVRHGVVDHSDSLGSSGRFGGGDVQWMTAGAGICHSEMFPLLERAGSNRLELFQIWLNLPRAGKMAAPFFKMLWAEQIPRFQPSPGADVALVAGRLEGADEPVPPPPDSWAAREDSDVAIWTVRLAPGAVFTLPPAKLGEAVSRTVYFFRGAGASVGGQELRGARAVRVHANMSCELRGGEGTEDAQFLVLQGRPIAEPVVQHGPFVMNDRRGIAEAFADYQRDEFGGWPWEDDAPVHARAQARFARHADGRQELPGGA